MVKATEEVFNISMLYSKMRKGEIDTKEVTILAKKALITKDMEAIEKLSNMVFARGREEEKIDLAKHLFRKGYSDLIPLHYRKFIKDFY